MKASYETCVVKRKQEGDYWIGWTSFGKGLDGIFTSNILQARQYDNLTSLKCSMTQNKLNWRDDSQFEFVKMTVTLEVD